MIKGGKNIDILEAESAISFHSGTLKLKTYVPRNKPKTLKMIIDKNTKLFLSFLTKLVDIAKINIGNNIPQKEITFLYR